MDIREDFDAGEIGSEYGKQLALGSGGIGMSGNNDDSSFGRRCAIWHGITGGDGGSDLQSQKRFAAAVIAVEESDAREWETLLPEPANWLSWGKLESVLIDGKGGGEWIESILVLFRYILRHTEETIMGKLLGIGEYFVWRDC